MSNYNYDLIVIGAGPGGYVTAAKASKLGLKTAIVEQGTWGGVCLNIGCIPTKTLLKNAKVYHYLDVADKYGVSYDKSSLKIDWSKAQSRKDTVVKGLTNGVQFLMKSAKVDSLVGTGSAIDKNTIKVKDKEGSEKTYTTKYMIIATGSEVKMFDNPNTPVKGLSKEDLKTNKFLLTSTEILSLKEIPKTLTIIGGGVIGVEFACLFSTLGAKVTIIEFFDQILSVLDQDVSASLRKALESSGVEIITGHSVADLTKNKLTYYKADDKDRKMPLTITSDYILLSTGRTPITKGFDNINLQIKPNAAFSVNNKLEALDKDNKVVENIYVIGDANGERMLAHVASAQGLIVVNNILVKEGKGSLVQTINYNQMPNCIYTFPEAAAVGLTEAEVSKLYNNDKTKFLVKKLPFANNGKALADGETDGFVKLIVDTKYGEILGAHIVGSTATDMISEITNIMVSEATVYELANSCHPHPTLSEVVMDVAQDLEMLLKKK